jgi:hypothetical protein
VARVSIRLMVASLKPLHTPTLKPLARLLNLGH